MNYLDMFASSALTKLKRKIPYGWDLNIYRGCEHGCNYCYALYSHQYLKDDDFFNNIYCKQNIIELLEKELASGSWKREIVNIGGVTDSYQPIEKEKVLMRDVLKLMIKYKTPVIISTKSTLILRDYDLIEELAAITYVNVAETITTMDEDIRRKIEPKSTPSLDRFSVLREFKKTRASIGLHVMPIIPSITDNYDNFNNMFNIASQIGVDYVLPGTLYLRGETRKHFFAFIEKAFPNKFNLLYELYKTGKADLTYKDNLYKLVNELRDKYHLSSSYTKPMKERLSAQTPDLFSL